MTVAGRLPADAPFTSVDGAVMVLVTVGPKVPVKAAVVKPPWTPLTPPYIGAMKPERIKDFHDKMVHAGLYKPGEVDLSKVATMQFVNKGVGVALRKQLTAR